MLNINKIKSIVETISGDAVPYDLKNQLSSNPSCINFSSYNLDVPLCCDAPYDIVILDEKFKDFDRLDAILSERGKVVGFYKNDVKKFVRDFHSTKLFFWCEWIKSMNMVIFRRWRRCENKWKGQKAKKDETLMVYSEHGWGDVFHKLRYLNKIKEVFRGLVFFESRCGIKELIEENFDVEVVERGLDYKTSYCFEICQSDKVLGEMPNCTNYISAPKQETIADIGVVWDSHHLTFEKKHVDPKIFSCFYPSYKLLSLQKFTHQKINNTPNFFITRPMDNWLETAKLITSVDVVFSVDTSVAHLSAAMGKKTYVLLNGYYPTPIDKNPNWYSSVEILRSGKEKWSDVIKKTIDKI